MAASAPEVGEAAPSRRRRDERHRVGCHPRHGPDRYIARDARPSLLSAPVTELYVAAVLLILAQVVGIYALRTRKADVLFSVVMVVLAGSAIAIGFVGVLHRLHS